MTSPLPQRETGAYREALLRLLALEAKPFEERMREVLRVASETLAIERVSFWSFHVDPDVIVCEAMYRRANADFEQGMVVAAGVCPRYFEALKGGKIIAAEDALTDARTSEFADSYLRPSGIGSMLDVPIYVRGRLAGVLCHEHVGPARPWPPTELQFAMSVAQLFSIAIETRDRERAEEQLRRQNDLLQTVLDSMVEGVLVADAEGRLIQVNPSAAALFGGVPDRLPPTYWEPPHGVFAQDGVTPYPVEQLPLARAGRGENVDRTVLFLRTPARPTGLWISATARPLRDRSGSNRGAVSVFRDITEQRMTQERLAQQASALEAMSLLDELTGIYNRRGFLTLSGQIAKAARRAKRSMILFFMDLDYLKEINDKWGHGAGDQALRDTAALLRATFRESDVIARLGGDEFAVLAVEASTPEAFAARLGSRIEELNARPGRAFSVSLSVGTAVWAPDETRSLEELLQEADQKMYEQKRKRKTGRMNAV